MKVFWTEQAFERLKEISDYISVDSATAASEFINRIIERGENLGRFPKAGRKVPEIDSKEIREIIEGNYRLVYRIRKNSVEILTVFECHREFPSGDVTKVEPSRQK